MTEGNLMKVLDLLWNVFIFFVCDAATEKELREILVDWANEAGLKIDNTQLTASRSVTIITIIPISLNNYISISQIG